MNLYNLTQEFQMLADSIEENGGELTPELEAAWEQNSLELAAKVDSYNHVIQEFAGREAAIDAEIKRLTALKKTAQSAQKTIKNHIAHTMQVQGLQKLEGETCKMSLRKSMALDVDTDTVLSLYSGAIDDIRKKLPTYITVKFDVSKTAIKDEFGAMGVLPQGCAYIENVSLQIR